MNYGPHLIIDAAATRGLDDPVLIEEVLTRVPLIMDMEVLEDPKVLYFDGNGQREMRGWTGSTIISTSHVAIHTYPEKHYFFFDAFSCLPFDHGEVIRYIANAFHTMELNDQVLKRGHHFPR